MTQPQTLTQWLETAAPSPALAAIVAAMAAACAEIAHVLRTAPTDGLAGATDHTNVQGETQKQLDVVSNDIVIKALRENRDVQILISEELDEPLHLRDSGGYAVATDPLDGSSNLDVNVTVGTIFSVLGIQSASDLLQPGTRQLAAGYAAYGPSTSFVVTFGQTVAVFTLANSGEFLLDRAEVKVPVASAEYAINAARFRFWDEPTKAYVAENVAGETGPAGKRYNMRWVGSMVADIHRILMRGGIFLYPLDSETVAKGGRLRLLYEANPMALIVEAAGGGASVGGSRILDVQPSHIHQRVPVILGSREEVARVDGFYARAK